MSQLPVDLDTESIQYEGHWYTRDELARRIKGMLDSGDFAVGKPSQALEQLTVTLASLRTLALKVTPELADAINQAAARHGRSVSGVIRDAVSEFIGFSMGPVREMGPAAPRPGAADRPGKRPTEPEMPVVAVPYAPVPPELKATQPMPTPVPSSVIAGPGALKAAQATSPSVVVDRSAIITEEPSPEEAAAAVSLNPKKKQQQPQQDDESVERGWFGR
jgi:hypothetical protein